jgi:hypothetical protein
MKWLILSLLVFSCAKEKKFSRDEIILMGQDVEPSASAVEAAGAEAPTCTQYSEGCKSLFYIDVHGVKLIAVEFAHESEALVAAKKFRGYYNRNWFFDDVTGEPRLERFVTTGLKAKKPGEAPLEGH